ncbi:ThuA domain-containing protein [Rubripirellula amarantea]|nr:ThuA domain-containing protein [Rubripirellula amarantea]
MLSLSFTLAVVAVASILDSGVARSQTDVSNASEQSVDILLITGGCCHDYDFQTKAMQLAVKDHGIKANWTVVNDGGTGTDAQIALYDDPEWATGYDVVIHNECFADTKDPAYIRRITKAHHAGANAIVIHCAMHTYRGAEIDDWREFLGVTSRKHDHQSRYPVKIEKPGHPIMANVPADYVSATDELYVIEKLWPRAEVLATSESENTKVAHPVFWTNTYGQAKVFGTTYGHSNDTFSDDVFLGVLCRAVVWLSQPE